jgi:DNA-binding MarR family transcriptional regulator
VIKTLTTRGWLARVPSKADRRLVLLELTASGEELMNELYPKFNAAESAAVAGLSAGQVDELTATLRTIVEDVSQPAESAAPD